MAGFPGGAARRRVAQYGEKVGLVNENLVADESSDWSDPSGNETTTDALMAIMPRSQASREVVESGVRVEADYVGYVAAAELEDAVVTGDTDEDGEPIHEDFPLREGENATIVQGNRREYRVVRAHENAAGIYEVLLE